MGVSAGAAAVGANGCGCQSGVGAKPAWVPPTGVGVCRRPSAARRFGADDGRDEDEVVEGLGGTGVGTDGIPAGLLDDIVPPICHTPGGPLPEASL